MSMIKKISMTLCKMTVWFVTLFGILHAMGVIGIFIVLWGPVHPQLLTSPPLLCYSVYLGCWLLFGGSLIASIYFHHKKIRYFFWILCYVGLVLILAYFMLVARQEEDLRPKSYQYYVISEYQPLDFVSTTMCDSQSSDLT